MLSNPPCPNSLALLSLKNKGKPQISILLLPSVFFNHLSHHPLAIRIFQSPLSPSIEPSNLCSPPSTPSNNPRICYPLNANHPPFPNSLASVSLKNKGKPQMFISWSSVFFSIAALLTYLFNLPTYPHPPIICRLATH